MTVFELIFSLYSLLFGLALAQVFAGFGNTLQERRKIKVGWLTPLLGLFVTFDTTSFWEIAWEMRVVDMSRPYFLYLICGVLLAGIYYLAARLVFPRDFVEWPDFDVYYFQHKQWVFGGLLLCNLIAAAALLTVSSEWRRFVGGPLGGLNEASYFILLIALMAARTKRANIVLLILMLARYAVFPLLIFLTVAIYGHRL